MATRQLADGASSKKRGATAEFEKPDAKKKPDTSSASDGKYPSYPPKPLTPAERLEQARKTAQYVDDQTAKRNAILEANEFLSSHPTWNPKITSTDAEWIAIRSALVDELKIDSVKDVLDRRNLKPDAEGPKDPHGNPLLDRYGAGIFNVDRYKYLMLVQPNHDGLILEMQIEDAKLYKAALKTEQFKGVHDNLATKLTMLHFGLPIESITMNNITHAMEDDKDDDEDPVPDPPQVQRIIHSEKPLEFLDRYHERGFGFHVLRRAKASHVDVPVPRTTLPITPLKLFGGSDPDPPFQLNHAHVRAPIEPTGDHVGMRGGAGAPKTRTLYNHYAGSHTVNVGDDGLVPLGEFLNAALYLLDLHPASKWIIVFDQYNNLERSNDKRSMTFVRSFEASRSDFAKMYETYLQARISNEGEDWIIVVQYKHVRDGEMYPPLIFNTQLVMSDSRGTLPAQNTRPLNIASASHLPATSTPTAPPRHPAILTGPPLLKDYIYGYRGRTKVAGLDSKSFAEAAVGILALDYDLDDWFIHVDIWGPGGLKSLTMSKRTLDDKYKDHILSVRNADGTYPMFVRDTRDTLLNPSPVSNGQMQPDTHQRDVVRLTDQNGRTAYWRIPDPTVRFGINQIQDDFFMAMQVLFSPGKLRPRENVIIGGVDLGPGGLELTQELWNQLVRDYSSPEAVEYTVTVEDKSLNRMTSGTLAPVRMAGATKFGYYTEGDFDSLAEEINKLLADALKLGGARKKPAELGIWYTPEDREDGVRPQVLQFTPPTQLAQRLKKWFESQNGRKTNCLWFRPIWTEFEVIDLDNAANKSIWKPAASQSGETLEAFRLFLNEVFPLERAIGFQVSIAESGQRFVVDTTTTQEQWRRNVFDNFLGPKLHLKLDNNLVYKITKDGLPWGLWVRPKSSRITIPRVIPARPQLSRGLLTPSPLPPHHQHHHHHPPQAPPTPAATRMPQNPAPPRATPTGSQTLVRQPNFQHNRSRRVPGERAHIPRPEKISQFDSWMSEQTARNALHQRSWTQDLSVIEPGYKPAAPFFGDVLELPLTVGSNLPTVYAHHLTPTDIAKLLQEKRKAVNHALERQIACPICPEAFAAYDVEAKKKHYESHVEQLNAGKLCPMCGINWGFYTFEQRKNHIVGCQITTNKQDVEHFWAATKCPICDTEFKFMKPEAVIAHMTGHIPGALKYCDRCGIDLLSCTARERSYHDNMCVHTDDHPLAVDIKCDHCGQEKKPGEGRAHDTCGDNVNKHCIRCGFSLSELSARDQEGHRRRCRVLCGPTGTYCRRCGTNLSILDALGIATHKNECYRREPFSAGTQISTARARAIEEQRIQNDIDSNELKQQRAEIAQRLRELKDRERGLPARASRGFGFDNRVNLGVCPIKGCGATLDIKTAQELRHHFTTHSGLTVDDVGGGKTRDSSFRCPLDCSTGVGQCSASFDPEEPSSIASFKQHYQHRAESGFGPCDTAALQEALRAFKARMPEFRDAHKALQDLASSASQASSKETPVVIDLENGGLTPVEANNARETRAQQSDLLKQLSADAKAAEARKAALTAQRDNEAAELATHTAALRKLGKNPDGSPIDPANPDLDPDATPVDQAGFMPSPPRASYKEIRSLRKSRSVRGRAPTTGSKRKKASMDEAEEAPSGRSALQRSPSKRETKKMKTAGHGMSSPDKRRLRQVTAEEGEGRSAFDGEGVSTLSMPRRMTRATSETSGPADMAPRRAGRPRKNAVEDQVDDDGFEDVEEEEDDEEGRFQ